MSAHLPVERPVKLLGDIVGAHGVLEGQVEQVVPLQPGVALTVAGPAVGRPALQLPARSEHVHGDVLLQQLDVVLPVGVGVAVGDHPGGEAGLGKAPQPREGGGAGGAGAQPGGRRGRGEGGRAEGREPAVGAGQVGVGAVGHCPVEEVVEPLVGVVQRVIEGRLHEEEDIALPGSPPLLAWYLVVGISYIYL